MFGGKVFESKKIIVSWLEVFNFGDTYFKQLLKKLGYYLSLLKNWTTEPVLEKRYQNLLDPQSLFLDLIMPYLKNAPKSFCFAIV